MSSLHIPVRLRPRSSTPHSPDAWLVEGGAAEEWFAEMAQWNVTIEDFRFFALPVGLLVIPHSAIELNRPLVPGLTAKSISTFFFQSMLTSARTLLRKIFNVSFLQDQSTFGIRAPVCSLLRKNSNLGLEICLRPLSAALQSGVWQFKE